MKKIISGILCITIMVCMMLNIGIVSYAEDLHDELYLCDTNSCYVNSEIDNFYKYNGNFVLSDYDYDIRDDQIILIKYIGTASEIYIPSTAVVDGQTYPVRLTMMCNGFFENKTNLKSIVFSKEFDTSNVAMMSAMFFGCSALEELDISAFDTQNVYMMNGMFYGCSSLKNIDLRSFNTSNVYDMDSMFANCSSLERLDLSGFKTSNVQDMSYMFMGCKSLNNLDVSSFRTDNVTDICMLFNGCSELTTIDMSNWNLNNITDSSRTIGFYECDNLIEIRTPLYLHGEAPLPFTFVQSDNPSVEYTSLPLNQSVSHTITKKIESRDIPYDLNKEQKTEMAWEVLEIVNQERAKEGLKPLVMDRIVMEATQVRSNEITEVLSHTRPDGTAPSTALPYGYEWKFEGENIAAGQRTAQQVMDGWMNSPGHRDNILNRQANSIGIACCYVPGSKYGYYWVQMFHEKIFEPILKGGVPAEPVTTKDGSTPMYRAYNHNTGEHFYTGNYNEMVNLGSVGWQYEGVAWYAPNEGEPVYRLYNPYSGDHHYTLYTVERDALVNVGWIYEGEAWKSNNSGNGTPVYRLFNPNAQTASHHYTTNVGERDYLILNGWLDEGIGWYGN